MEVHILDRVGTINAYMADNCPNSHFLPEDVEVAPCPRHGGQLCILSGRIQKMTVECYVKKKMTISMNARKPTTLLTLPLLVKQS